MKRSENIAKLQFPMINGPPIPKSPPKIALTNFVRSCALEGSKCEDVADNDFFCGVPLAPIAIDIDAIGGNPLLVLAPSRDDAFIVVGGFKIYK